MTQPEERPNTANLGAFADVAQLVEHWLPKPGVVGSSPIVRSHERPAISVWACRSSRHDPTTPAAVLNRRRVGYDARRRTCGSGCARAFDFRRHRAADGSLASSIRNRTRLETWNGSALCGYLRRPFFVATLGSRTSGAGAAKVITRWSSTASVTPTTTHVTPARTRVSRASGTLSVVQYSQLPSGKRSVIASSITTVPRRMRSWWRVGVERCRRASRAAGVRCLISSVPVTRPCSATPNGGRERSCARRDRASHHEARRDPTMRGSVEDNPSREWHLYKPHHHYLRFHRPRRSGLRRVNAEREAREAHGSSSQTNSGDRMAVRDVSAREIDRPLALRRVQRVRIEADCFGSASRQDVESEVRGLRCAARLRGPTGPS